MLYKSINEIQTERMLLQAIRHEHLHDLCTMHSDQKVMATLGGVRNNNETKLFMEHQLHHWEKYGYGEWIVFEKESYCFIGRCGLRRIIVNDGKQVEIGYKLLSPFWGRGLATELAESIIYIAFKELELHEIVCLTTPNNKASIRVMEKVGFIYESNIVKNNQSHVFYRMNRSDWETKNK